MPGTLIAINVTRQVRLTRCARIADNILTRVIGLLLDKTLEIGDGLWISPCNSIHSIGMGFLFDAVFLDKDLRVVYLVREMKPWRISKMVLRAHSILELPAGLVDQSGTQLGDQFEMQR